MAILDRLKRKKEKSAFTKNWKLSASEAQQKYAQTNSYGLVNPSLGIGGDSDVLATSYNQHPGFVSFDVLDRIYRTNVFAQKIINAPAEDMVRKWREFTCDDVEKAEKRQKAEVGYQIKDKVKDAVRYADLYGGSALLIVLQDQDWMEPLDISKIRQGELVKLQPVFLGEMFSAGPINYNPSSPYFETPEYYNINNMGNIHRSRLIIFEGIPLSLYSKITQMGFGDSRLTSCIDILNSAQIVWKNIVNLLVRANIDVIGIKDFQEVIANDSEALFNALSCAQTIQGTYGKTVMDAEDNFTRHEISGFSGMVDVLMGFLQLIASIVPMPLTKLIGTSVDGFGTGETELVQYYDDIAAKQNKIMPTLKIIDEIMERHLFGEYIGMEYDWLSLHEPNASEKADLEFKQMETMKGYLEMGIMSPEIAGRHVRKMGVYDGYTDEFVAQLSGETLSPEEQAELDEIMKGTLSD